MNITLKHPCGIITYAEFSVVPRKGDSFCYNDNYKKEVINQVCGKYNIKKSYQLTNILFRRTDFIVTNVNFVCDYDYFEENSFEFKDGIYIPEIELMQLYDDLKKDAGYYPTYSIFLEFVKKNETKI